MKMRKEMGKLLFVCFALSGIFLNAETNYRVKGRVIRNGDGFPNVNISIFTNNKNSDYFWNGKTDLNSFNERNRVNTNITTDKNGEFSLFIPNGKYSIICNIYNLSPDNDEFFAIGPTEFAVNNCNVFLNFRVFTKTEIVEGNMAFLMKPSQHEMIQYSWGKIPIFSESECREVAQSLLQLLINKTKSNELKLVEPVPYYDFKGNKIFYEYRIFFNQVEIASYGIHAIGSYHPNLSINNFEVDELNEDIISKLKGKNYLTEICIPAAMKTISNEYRCNLSDIKVDQMISLAPDTPRLIKGTIISSGVKFLVTLDNSHCIIKNNFLDWEAEIQKYIELEYTFNYLWNIKRRMDIPLL
jgi:hypothetical protein